MNGLNRVICMGTVGQDAEVKTIDGVNGPSTVARISLALNDSYTDKSGQRQQTTEWVRVEAWNGLANFLSQFGKAGTNFLVEGKLKTETWEKDGITRSSTKVVADRILFTGGKSNNSNNNQAQQPQQQPMQQAPQQQMQQAPQQPMQQAPQQQMQQATQQQAPQQSVPQQTHEQVNNYVSSDQFVNGMNNGDGDDLPF